VQKVERELGPFDPRYLDALLRVPRALFVRPGDEALSEEDVPLPLDDEGRATVSAPHAYLLSFRLAALGPGDALVELGTGSGYGAALAAEIVGPRGRVTSIEIDEALARRARALLAERTNVTVMVGDAVFGAQVFAGAGKVITTFSVDAVPEPWLRALPDGGLLVAPVGPAHADQRLIRVVRRGPAFARTEHGLVRYVPNRSVARAS